MYRPKRDKKPKSNDEFYYLIIYLILFLDYPIIFLDLSISIFGFIRYDIWDYPLGYLFVLINSTLCYCFW